MTDEPAVADEAEEEHEPRGTVVMMAFFLLTIIIIWVWTYAVLLERRVKLQIEKWERWFLYATVVMLVAFLVAIFASIGEAGIHLPTDEDQIDPNVLDFSAFETNPAPFNDLGSRSYTGTEDDIDWEVVLLAKAWAFNDGSGDAVPSVIVPAGARVEFVITSVDTVHGMLIADVAVNAMVIPGQITRVIAEFDEPGEYKILCHEFCGLLHHNMYAIVEVVG